jgi:hypothetical protein
MLCSLLARSPHLFDRPSDVAIYGLDACSTACQLDESCVEACALEARSFDR